MSRVQRLWRPKGRFLREFARIGSVAMACRAAGLARRTVYRWRDSDADFRGRWEAARLRAGERQRDAAMERALHGEERPVWHDGRIVGHELFPDNPLLWRLFEATQADRYGPRARESQADRERALELRRRLDDADKRVARYHAELGLPEWDTDDGK